MNGVFLRIGCEVIDDAVASHHIASANGVLQLKYVVVFAYTDVALDDVFVDYVSRREGEEYF